MGNLNVWKKAIHSYGIFTIIFYSVEHIYNSTKIKSATSSTIPAPEVYSVVGGKPLNLSVSSLVL